MGFGFLDANSASQMIVLPEISLVKVAFCMLHTLIQGYDDLDLPLGFLFLSWKRKQAQKETIIFLSRKSLFHSHVSCNFDNDTFIKPNQTKPQNNKSGGEKQNLT